MSDQNTPPRTPPSQNTKPTPLLFTLQYLDLSPHNPHPKQHSTYSIATIYPIFRTILTTGPSAPHEWWIHELALYAQRHPSALTFTFSLSILQLAFKMSQKVFPPGSLNFKADMEHLLPLLPVKEGEVVRTDTLMEVIVQAARELGMEWWNYFRERAGVLFGVMHAGMIQRKRKEYRADDGVSEALGSMELGMDEGAVFERLAGELEDALKVKI